MAKVVIRVFGFRQARISKAMPAAWVRGGSLIPAPPQTHHAEFGYRTVISRSSMLLTNL
jgi:hypothetical protein